jgi:3-dehydroquinate dehydratase-1
LESSSDFKTPLIKFAKKQNCRVIISFHDFKKTPSKEELDAIVNSCFSQGADIAKIACMANSHRDSVRLLSLLDSDKTVLPIGMGEKGRITRVAAPLMGSPFTFASLLKDDNTAPGQYCKESLKQIYYLLGSV